MKTTQVIRVFISLNKSVNTKSKNAIIYAFISAERLILKKSSFRARARNIETFIYSQIIHQLRHEILSKSFFASGSTKQYNIRKEILALPTEEGGINPKGFSKYYLAAKIMNLKFLAFNPKEEK